MAVASVTAAAAKDEEKSTRGGDVKGDDDGYTKDGSVDLRGNPVLRSTHGSLRACYFITIYEVFERMAFYGISSNLVVYLTTKLHQGTVESANNVTNWVGTIWMTPLLGAYIGDALLGRFWTFVIASGIYLLGMCLLTLAVSLKSLRPPECIAGVPCKPATGAQVGIFFLALYILAVGTGGTKPNISTMGADQFDDSDRREQSYKLRFFNWWMFSIYVGTLVANSFLIYIQDNVGWPLGYGIPTIGLAVSLVIFAVGVPFYRHKPPSGSPLTKIARVLVAAVRKAGVPAPADPCQLHELPPDHYAASRHAAYVMEHSPAMSALDKAAVKTGESSPWMLCTVTEVEETKRMAFMIPILIATFIPGVMFAQVNTLFVKQGTTLDRHLGSHFQMPPASLQAFTTLSMLISTAFYDRLFIRLVRRWTGNPRGITILQRIGAGMVFHILLMVVASLTERRRLAVAREHGPLVASGAAQVPLSIFVILPQFVLMGVADALIEVGKLEFFYDQAPESMKSLGTAYFTTCLGVGNFLSSVLLRTTERVTRRGGRSPGWILNNLNASHLDYYYAFFAVLNALNFAYFLVVSHFYKYKAEAGYVAGGGGGASDAAGLNDVAVVLPRPAGDDGEGQKKAVKDN